MAEMDKSDDGLPFFEEGKPLLEQVTAAKLNGMVSSMRKNAPKSSSSIIVKQTPGGSVIESLVRNRGGSSTTDHPFKISIRPNPSNPLIIEAFVGLGYLMETLIPNDDIAISSLETWSTVVDGSKIWLEGSVTNYALTSVAVTIGTTFATSAAAWAANAYVTDTGTPLKQNKFRLLIGLIYTNDDDNLTVRQSLTTNLIIRNAAIDGKAAIYPIPWQQPYIAA